MRSRSCWRFARLLILALAGCGGAQAGGEPSSSSPSAGPRVSPVDAWFPLEDGRLYAYDTTEGGDTGMLVAKVRRIDETHGELRLSNATKRFRYDAEGVRYDDTGVYLLKAPLAVGTKWPGEHGGITAIDATDASVKVPAGEYSGCVRTLETGGRPPGATYATTYCPTVGMVLLEVSAMGTQARAALKSYGFPVKIP